MSGPQFFQTGIGRKFYEADIPAILKAMNRIADALEAKQTIVQCNCAQDDGQNIAVIRWHEDDLIDSMKRAGLDPSEENIRKFMESRARKTLHERSVQEG